MTKSARMVSAPGLLLAVVVVTSSPGAVATPAASAKSTCLPRGYVVEKRTQTTVVVRRRSTGRVYGCLPSRGRLVRLPGAAGPYAAAGRYVAYEQSTSDPAGLTQRFLAVRSLINGRLRRGPAIYALDPNDPSDSDYENAAQITDVTLKRNGSIAWISCLVFEQRCTPRDPMAPYQVWRADSGGTKLLESSDAVRLRSLHRDANSLNWRSGERLRRATLR